MNNLLLETINILKKNRKSLKDILFVSTDRGDFYPSKNCANFLNVNYINAYGVPQIDETLKLVGKDFWLERHAHDGSEWWEFKQLPKFKKRARQRITPFSEFALEDEEYID